MFWGILVAGPTERRLQFNCAPNHYRAIGPAWRAQPPPKYAAKLNHRLIDIG
jgi:hypothetical protein